MDADREPAAGGLTPLSELPGFTVAAGDPDVRGWTVVAGDGRVVGRVHDLLVDVAAMKVRYLVVELERDPLPPARGSGELADAAEPGLGDRGLGSPEAVAPAPGASPAPEVPAAPGGDARRVLIPIGYARVDEEDERVRLESLRSTEVAALPAYGGDALDRDWEAELHQPAFPGPETETSFPSLRTRLHGPTA